MPDTSPTPVEAALAELDSLTRSPYSDPTCYRDDFEIVAAELRSARASIGPDSERIRELEAENAKYKSALDEIDRMNPDDFRTGQGHLSAAFREVNFQAAFAHVCRVVNRTLHGIDSAEGPSR